MATDDSVTAWIAALKAGDAEAARELWDRYFPRLVGLAREALRSSPRRAANEEDAALSAFKSFCLRAGRGKFPRLEDRDDLWKLLMTITVRKALHLARKERRAGANAEPDFLAQLTGAEPDPGSVFRIKDEFERLLSLLDDPTLRATALCKLEGYTNSEIAEKFGRSLSTVERKLQLIRRIWSQEDPG